MSSTYTRRVQGTVAWVKYLKGGGTAKTNRFWKILFFTNFPGGGAADPLPPPPAGYGLNVFITYGEVSDMSSTYTRRVQGCSLGKILKGGGGAEKANRFWKILFFIIFRGGGAADPFPPPHPPPPAGYGPGVPIRRCTLLNIRS